MPPNTGIVHQVNLEYLGRVVFHNEAEGDETRAYPDTVVGTDSHTTMINGLGVLGWGVGGIEAEAAMLGQPVTMLIPQVIGFKMTGAMKPGCTATDLVLTVTEMLRKKGVVDKFVEFFGDGLANLPLADRATIANMAPEYGSTCGIFPIDEETLRYLELSGRPPEQIALVEAYAKAQGMWRVNGAKPADYTDVLELDLATVEPSLAGPKRPQDRVPLSKAKSVYQAALKVMADERKKKLPDATGCAEILLDGKKERHHGRRGDHRRHHQLHQHVESLRAHGRRPARAQCREARAQVQALGEDQPRARLARRHRLPDQGRVVSAARVHRLQCRRLRLHHLHRQLRPVEAGDLRGHQGGRHRGHLGALGQPQFRRPRASGNQDELPGLAAARGRVCARRAPWTWICRPKCWGTVRDGKPVLLANIWPSDKEVADAVHATLTSAMFRKSYANVFAGDANWQAIKIPAGQDLRVGRKIHLRAQSALLRRHDHDAASGHRRHRRALPRTCWATASPPTTSRRPATSPRPARRRNTWCRRACSPSTSTPTARAAATTKS